jgi:hypothetical protein
MVGSFSTGGSTLIKVIAVYIGQNLKSPNQPATPTAKPSIVDRIIISQCLRSVMTISLGVIVTSAWRTAAGLGIINLGSFNIGFCPASAIFTPAKNSKQRQALFINIFISNF